MGDEILNQDEADHFKNFVICSLNDLAGGSLQPKSSGQPRKHSIRPVSFKK
jgi:hypothetical protein